MASSSVFLLPLSLLLLLTPTALSAQACDSQKFSTPGKSFASCTNLPHLSATLHWTFNSSASTLSMAYTAPPASPSGWVAWAINPSAAAMVGSQALLASLSSDGSLSVSTYSLQAQALPSPGPLSYNVSGIAAEASSAGSFTIFADWELSPNTESIIQVWQVGSSVTNGKPDPHARAADNLASTGNLALTSSPAPGTTVSGASPPPPPGMNGAAEVSAGVWLGLALGAFGFLF